MTQGQTFMDSVVVDSDKGNEAEHSCLEEMAIITYNLYEISLYIMHNEQCSII